MSEAKQSDSTDLSGQFLEAARRDGVSRMIPPHPDDIRAALDAKDAEIERLQWDLGELRGRIAQMERDEGKSAAAERERCLDVRLADDDALRFACRVLESEAPAADKAAARDGLMAIRTRIRA